MKLLNRVRDWWHNKTIENLRWQVEGLTARMQMLEQDYFNDICIKWQYEKKVRALTKELEYVQKLR